jgi:gluconolactonase
VGLSGAGCSARGSFATDKTLVITMRAMLLLLTLFTPSYARPAQSILQPLPKYFDAGDAAVVFLKNRLNVLPEGFGHTQEGNSPNQPSNPDEPFFNIKVPNERIRSELEKISAAQFIAFDSSFFDLIGPKPRLQRMFNLSTSLREAPVYIPSSNALFVSDMGARKQMRINLTEENPTLEYVSYDPPLEGINGAAYSVLDDLIYATVNPSEDVSSGIYAIDPYTLESHVVLNNYVGHHFNSPNDLVVDGHGIWFTDPPYASLLGNGSTAELRPNVYFYDISSTVLRVVEEDLQLPNGIALSPDRKVLYIADSGALCQPIGRPTVASEHRSIYAYDILNGQLRNRRLVYISDFWVPDGIKVSRAGYIFAAAGIFVDVISPEGILVGKIRFHGLMQNVIFAGPRLDALWVVGLGGVYKIKLSDQGIPFSRSQFHLQNTK